MKGEVPVPTPTPTPAEKPKNPSANAPVKKPTAANYKKVVSSKEVVKNSQKPDSGVSAGWKGNTLKLSWKAVQGAGGYEIFAAQCGKKFGKKSLVKTVKRRRCFAVMRNAGALSLSGNFRRLKKLDIL